VREIIEMFCPEFSCKIFFRKVAFDNEKIREKREDRGDQKGKWII